MENQELTIEEILNYNCNIWIYTNVQLVNQDKDTKSYIRTNKDMLEEFVIARSDQFKFKALISWSNGQAKAIFITNILRYA